MVGADIEEFPIMMDKKEAVAEIKRNLKDKWKRKFDLGLNEIYVWFLLHTNKI